MKQQLLKISVFVWFAALLLSACGQKEKAMKNDEITKLPQTEKSIIRLSKIEVYPEFLDEYTLLAKEVGAISMRTEAGVLTMYGMAEKENPCRITILEIYADTAAYKSHIASAHFQKYKTSTLKMVKSLELVDQNSMNTAMNLR